MKIKTKKNHLTLATVTFIKRTRNNVLAKNMKKGNICLIHGTEHWCRHCGKEYGGSSQKLKIELSCDAAIHILGIYLETPKTVIQNDMCTYKLICNIIYKIHDMETDQVSVHRWMNG